MRLVLVATTAVVGLLRGGNSTRQPGGALQATNSTGGWRHAAGAEVPSRCPIGTVFDLGFFDGADSEAYLAAGYCVVAVEADTTLAEKGRRNLAPWHKEGRFQLINAAIAPLEAEAGDVYDTYQGFNTQPDQDFGGAMPAGGNMGSCKTECSMRVGCTAAVYHNNVCYFRGAPHDASTLLKAKFAASDCTLMLRRSAGNSQAGVAPDRLRFYENKCNPEWNSFFSNVGCRSCQAPHSVDMSSCEVKEVKASSCTDVLLHNGKIPVYLKLDIEGAETGCLEAFKRHPEARPQYVSLEITGPDYIDRLHEAGYTKFKLVRQDTIAVKHTSAGGLGSVSGGWGEDAEDCRVKEEWRDYKSVRKEMVAVVSKGHTDVTEACPGGVINIHQPGASAMWYDIHAKLPAEGEPSPVLAVSPPLPGGGRGSAPRLHFLMLAMDGIPHVDVWSEFFFLAPSNSYTVYVHCTDFAACQRQEWPSNFVQISTVPSQHCWNLIDPMNHLIGEALRLSDEGTPHANDKFVFLSETTLPVKPFREMYASLTDSTESEFCLFTSQQWMWPQDPAAAFVFPKHHQWIVLSTDHAQQALRAWRSNAWAKMSSWIQSESSQNRVHGCLDEFWHFTAVFHPFPWSDWEHDIQVPGYAGSVVHVKPGAQEQGVCRTFVDWSGCTGCPDYIREAQHASTGHLVQQFAPGDKIETLADRPTTFYTVSEQTLKALRSSNFYFARKFDPGATAADGSSLAALFASAVYA